ncbi:hypothetical protein ACFE04_017555 [Oxalis oulophora]
MLDGLLGRGFAAKCKSLMKLTKSRIDVIRRKRNATQKFLKKDIADLLFNGLDINAYGRAEGLMAELCLSSCYDFVYHCCDILSKLLSAMQKQRDCPENCREAISSLMFAAARFSDLPELRDLRDIFFERYGSSLELYVNEKLVENLTSSVPCTMEKKIKLLQDIATEFSIKWDFRGFELRMSNKPSASAQEKPKTSASYQKITNDNHRSTNDKDAVQRREKDAVLSIERPEHDRHKLHNENPDNISKRNESTLPSRQKLISDARDQSLTGREQTVPMKDKYDTPLHGRGEIPFNKHGPQNGKDAVSSIGRQEHDRHKLHNEKPDDITKRNESALPSRQKLFSDARDEALTGRERTVPMKDKYDPPLHGRGEVPFNKHRPQNGKEDRKLKEGSIGSSSLRKKLSENSDLGSKLRAERENSPPREDKERSLRSEKPEAIHNTKEPHNIGQHNIAKLTRNVQEQETYKMKPYLPPPYVKPNIKQKENAESSEADFEDPSKLNRSDDCDRSDKIRPELNHPNNEIFFRDVGLPKPKSVRRRHSKPRSRIDDVSSEDPGVVTRKSRSRRKDDSKRGLQILFNEEHENNDEEERIMDKLLIHYSKKPSAFDPEKLKRKSSRRRHPEFEGTDVPHDLPDKRPPPPRSVSLPTEQKAPVETPKVYARAESFQNDRSDRARHVHPNLPDDFDDLAARIAALKGR